jgi:hypothetical protein
MTILAIILIISAIALTLSYVEDKRVLGYSGASSTRSKILVTIFVLQAGLLVFMTAKNVEDKAPKDNIVYVSGLKVTVTFQNPEYDELMENDKEFREAIENNVRKHLTER